MSNLIVKILGAEQLNRWNDFVGQSPQGDVFCYSWWLDAITKSNFKILAVIENDQIVAGIPLPYDAQNKINEPPLTRTLGVLYETQDHLSAHKQISNQRKWLNALLEHLPLDDFVQMCMHHNFTDWLPFRWKGFNQTTRYTYIIDYKETSADKLWNNLSILLKRTIRKARKNEIRVEKDDNFELLYHYAGLSYQRQGIRLNIPLGDLKVLDEAITKNGNRIIFKAVDAENRIHAMMYFTFSKKSAYLLLSGSDAKYRELGGHSLLMWEAVNFFFGKVDYFNFGGSNIERIEKHFRGYGGTLTPYFHIYNQKYFGNENGFKYHSSKILFHFKEIVKIAGNRFLKK
jgi:hypothetical protein